MHRTALTVLAIAGGFAFANDNPVILQWFETEWEDIEYRAPDFFLAGYGAVWLPPPSKAADPTSAGFDVFDRFDFGSPGSPTTYGTEATFDAMVAELHRANGLVYVDTIMNHNSGRQTSASFQAAGGYPGFWMAPSDPPVNKQPTDDWGDFHGGHASGYYQSENPGAPFYDLFDGDLVALVDIAQESNHQFIRQPVEEGNPLNIPAGTSRNRPDPDNIRFYPDLDATPLSFFNPGAHGHGGQNFTIHPFTETPGDGDPVTDNTTGMLMRWAQWMLERRQIDGLRLDAAKHIPNWFWDIYYDSAVYQRRTTPDGRMVTPFSFMENVDGNANIWNDYIRKDGFGFRDALDLNGAGALRDINGAAGLGSWSTVLASHLDNSDDGLNNGSIGVFHVFSHDNGSVGNGGSMPPLPGTSQLALPSHAYMLGRTGRQIVYHNGRGIARGNGFFPREGMPMAMGFNEATGQLDERIVTLVDIHNRYGRGIFVPLNASRQDVLIYERSTPAGGDDGNLLVGVNDRHDAGFDQVTVSTSFPQGTRLHELTGNASDPAIDPGDDIEEVLVVGAGGSVTLRVPRNRSSSGFHGGGYVMYGPATPSGALTLTNVAYDLPADPPQVPVHRRRLNDIPVIEAGNFSIVLDTVQTDPLDPQTDDFAAFRLDEGFRDLNGNGSVDHNAADLIIPGYEDFLTVSDPLFGGGSGEYVQNISALDLEEGYHYVSVVAFRHRDPGTAPLFNEWRSVFYLDREGPAVEIDLLQDLMSSSHEFTIRALDRTATRTHLMLDLPAGTDPVAEADVFNLASRRDRFTWTKTLTGMDHGWHTITLVAFEITERASVQEFHVFVDTCRADVNDDAILDIFDVVAFLDLFEQADPGADFSGDGEFDIFDVLFFLGEFNGGC